MVSKSVMYGFTMYLVIITMISIFGSATSEVNQTASGEGNQTYYSVNITNFAFEPHELNVTVNSPVIWTNEDAAPHTIVTDREAVAEIISPNLNKGETFEFNFTSIGTYPYHCSVHPSMTGIIQVNP